MSDLLTIREAALATGLSRNRIFRCLLTKELGYRQLEPDGPYLLAAEEVGALAERGLAWARGWGELHPDESRVDRLNDWSTWKENARV